MSTPSSAPKHEDSSKSFAARAEERFFALDHVGVVRHFEGVDLNRLMPQAKTMLAERGAAYEDDLEELRGRLVYTNVATPQSPHGMTLWLRATLFEGVGVLVDAKLFHSTEQSAEADELLSRFIAELQQKMMG